MKHTLLKRHTRLKPMSAKQRDHEREWGKITHRRAQKIEGIFGIVICEYCGRPHNGMVMGGHHIDGDHQRNADDNCYMVHWLPCHQFITDHNLVVKQLDFQGVPGIYRELLLENIPKEVIND
jgi:hypothetical protein